MSGFFGRTEPVVFKGPDSGDALAFRFYDKDRAVGGRTLEQHLRFAVAYWHSLNWPGSDPFGGETFGRAWMQPGDAMAQARAKAEVAFEMFRLLDVPFFCFHDRDVAPEGATLAESNANLAAITDLFEARMADAKVRLLWGTADLFSHRRYMAGAATNPDPDVFAYACGQVRAMMDVTHRLNGENYVLWGGREGYETLLNTDLAGELDRMGRFLSLVVEHKHRIGFAGTILIEPKPQEPTKHQYDRDVASVHGFLRRHGLEGEVKLNLEANHATLAGHAFQHEVALASALGLLGSLDVNRGDAQSGWDTDQFPRHDQDLTMVFYHVLRQGGLGSGGCNFDAKVRRQSLDPEDLLAAHVGGMDACARSLLAADALISDGRYDRALEARYEGWKGAKGRAILKEGSTLAGIADAALAEGREPQPRSGRQERLESLIDRFV